MNGKMLASQLQFLTDVGLYSGPINTPWGREQSDAMKGWAARHHSGNPSGQPMSGLINPPGYSFIAGELVCNEPKPKTRGHVDNAAVLDEVAFMPPPLIKPAALAPLSAAQIETKEASRPAEATSSPATKTEASSKAVKQKDPEKKGGKKAKATKQVAEEKAFRVQ